MTVTSGPNRNLNLQVRRIERSATLAINERSAELQRQGKKIYRLGLGQSPFPVPDSVVAELQNQAHQKDYLPVSGLQELRQAVSDYHNRRDSLTTTADDILIGPGSKELLFLAQFCYGGELIVPAPSWVSYQPQASLLGQPTTWVDTTLEGGWRLEAEALAKACDEDPTRPRLLILNYPNNPAGTSLDKERLQKIAAVCRKSNLLVLSDEIYGEVNHRGDHVSIATFYPEGTIISSGLSKWCGAGGWRLGTFAFPKNLHWLREAMSVVASETFTSVSAPIQWAAVRAFQMGPDILEYLKDSRAILRAVGEYAHQKLTESGLDVPAPDGGFYLFPNAQPLAAKLKARDINDSPSLCEQLLVDTGVAVLPGTQFGRQPEELSFRMATVNFDGGAALVAAAKTPQPLEMDFVKEQCPDLVEALDKLGEWLAL